jgi:periplasmic divalent cation tolerance protein
MPMAMVYFTAANREDALEIGRLLVEERLAACVNLLGEITSLYHWEGALQEETEVAAIAKTSTDRVRELIDRFKQIHKYDCPCVVSWTIGEGNPAFLDWIQRQTESK